jgi:glycosyltransferase involved in cell wall biosynthesis
MSESSHKPGPLPPRPSAPDRRFRVLAVATHPVQYSSPNFRRLSKHPQLEVKVAYCSLQGAEAAHDAEFNATVKWDVPLLDGYDWVEIPNKGSGAESFFGLYNSGLWTLILQEKFDAILCFAGYVRASFWVAYLASRFSGSAFLFGTDASTLASRIASRWKVAAKKLLWPRLFSLADQVIVPSSATRDVMLGLKVPEDRITLTPYCVDNDWWVAESSKVDRTAVRAAWRAEPSTSVTLFCAKLQPWKRPMDLLHAFAIANSPNTLLVFAGEGPLRPELERDAVALGIGDRVRFLGFVNQSKLPAVYTSADLLVLPSEYEPFAVVVNEASCCGCPVAASDRVGATRDLIAPVNPGLIFSCGDVEGLARILRQYLSDKTQLAIAARNARSRMDTWSPKENIEATVDAIRIGITRKRNPPHDTT